MNAPITSLAWTVALCAAVAGQNPFTVLEPNGGETYSPGDTLRVRWEADETSYVVGMVVVEFSPDLGLTWYLVSERISPTSSTWCDYPWIVPAMVHSADDSVSTLSTDCLMRVRSYIDQVTNDESDDVFAIVPDAGVRQRPVRVSEGCACPGSLRVWFNLAGRALWREGAAGLRTRGEDDGYMVRELDLR